MRIPFNRRFSVGREPRYIVETGRPGNGVELRADGSHSGPTQQAEPSERLLREGSRARATRSVTHLESCSCRPPR